jgi:RecB family exonuclease
VALRLIGRDYLSYSAVSSYQRCPLSYYFRYVASVKPEFVPSSLTFGGSIHAAIESWYRARFAAERPPTVNDQLVVFDAAWKEESQTGVRFGKGEDENSLRDLAARMLGAFREFAEPRREGQLLAVEEEFRSPLIGGCPDILGRLDLLTLTSDALRVTDFKTSRSAWGDEKIREALPQQLLYGELVRPLAESLGNRPIRLEWVVLTKTRQPAVEQYSIAPCPREIARTKATVRQVWQAVVAGHFYPCPSAMNCPSCPYAGACRRWEG